MASALESLLSRGNYLFRVEDFTAEISSSQIDAKYQSRADIHLECERVSGDWPEKLWPCDFRIVAGTITDIDKTKEGQLVLGFVRRVDEQSVEAGMIAGAELTASLLSALTQNVQKVFLKIETAQKLEDWSGDGWVPVLSFTLVIGSRA